MTESGNVAAAVSLAVMVLVMGSLFTYIGVARRRLRGNIAAAGRDAIRVRLQANRRGYAAGLVPVVEELLQRVEALETEVAVLRRER